MFFSHSRLKMAVFGITDQRYKLKPLGFRREFARTIADGIMATYSTSVKERLKQLSSKHRAVRLTTDYLIAKAFEYEETGDDLLLLPMQMLRECFEDFGSFYNEETFISLEMARHDRDTSNLKRLNWLNSL